MDVYLLLFHAKTIEQTGEEQEEQEYLKPI